MSDNIEFLNYIYQNAHMGVIGIEHIENNIEDEKLKNVIMKQKDEYQNLCNNVVKMFVRFDKMEKDINAFAKIGSYMSAKMNLMKDSSASNIAKMMIEGSNKGIIEITEKINAYPDSDPEIINLANRLLATENVNVEELKPFL